MKGRVSRVSVAALVLSLLLLFGGCSTMRSEYPSTPSYALAEAKDTALRPGGRVRCPRRLPGSPASGSSSRGAKPLPPGPCWQTCAERTLDLQYYSAGNDMTTDLLLLRIEAAARARGAGAHPARRHLSANPALRSATRQRQHPGIEVRLYNPFFWSDGWDPVAMPS